jgi:hypothetical protein
MAWAGFICLMSFSVAASPGGEGNGGDFIEGLFIREGQGIIESLQTTTKGRAIANAFSLNLEDLKGTLQATRIFVQTEPLYDNTMAEVDAVCSGGAITLNRSRWDLILSQPSERSRFFVFHEMLRSAGVDDDNYRVSQYLDSPIKIPSLVPVKPLSERINTWNMSMTLDEPYTPMNSAQFKIDNSTSSIEIKVPQYQLHLWDPSPAHYRLEVPIHLAHGESIRLTQIQYWLTSISGKPHALEIVSSAGYRSQPHIEQLSYVIDKTFDGSYLTRSPIQGPLRTNEPLILEFEMKWKNDVSLMRSNPMDGASLTRIFLYFEISSQ